MGLCLFSLGVKGTGAMGVPRWADGRKALKVFGFSWVQGCDCRRALLHIETV
jgi:hypothetical protein